MELYELESEAQAICDYWARKIGLGFHLDIPASDYNPPIKDARRYHVDMRRLNQICAIGGLDPYEFGVNALEKL